MTVEPDWENMTDDEVCEAVGCQHYLAEQDAARIEKMRLWIIQWADEDLERLRERRAKVQEKLDRIDHEIQFNLDLKEANQ